jgi:GTP-binding protein
MATNAEIAVVRRDGGLIPARVTRIYRFRGNEREATDAAGCGEIVAVAGMDEVTVGVTYTDPEDPAPLPPMDIDPPTLSMNFIANDSPFAGREGTYVTSTHLAERLRREVLSDVALHVEDLEDGSGYRVSGRGELHLSILIERMRREGYEFQVTSPRAIILEDEGGRQEPYEDLTIDVDERFVGGVIESLGARKGQMLSMENEGGMIRLLYRIPTRGLLGFRSQFLTDTKGMGVMNYVFAEYGPYAGEIRTRRNGAMVSMATGATVGYALFNLQERGRLFLGPGEPVYTGQVIGEHCRTGDLTVNPCKGKKLTNMRASGSDENVILTPPVRMALEICLSFINDDELVELTPKAIRLRKIRGRTKP